jgi:hypothetical protein
MGHCRSGLSGCVPAHGHRVPVSPDWHRTVTSGCPRPEISADPVACSAACLLCSIRISSSRSTRPPRITYAANGPRFARRRMPAGAQRSPTHELPRSRTSPHICMNWWQLGRSPRPSGPCTRKLHVRAPSEIWRPRSNPIWARALHRHRLVAPGALRRHASACYRRLSARSRDARWCRALLQARAGRVAHACTQLTASHIRYCSADSGSFGRAVHLDLVAAADGWISHLAWTPWVSRSAGTCKQSACPSRAFAAYVLSAHALLACACADGSVKTIEVTQHLEQPTTPSAFNGNYTVRLALPEEPSPIGPPDGRGVTALRWACQPGGEVVRRPVHWMCFIANLDPARACML